MKKSTGTVKMYFFEEAMQDIWDNKLIKKEECIKITKNYFVTDYESFVRFQKRVSKLDIEICSPGLNKIIILPE